MSDLMVVLLVLVSGAAYQLNAYQEFSASMFLLFQEKKKEKKL
jgi:hypothetical protein